MTIPTKEEIRAARVRIGLSQAEAARVVHVTTRAWQQYESGDRGMSPALWELFQIKIGVTPWRLMKD